MGRVLYLLLPEIWLPANGTTALGHFLTKLAAITQKPRSRFNVYRNHHGLLSLCSLRSLRLKRLFSSCPFVEIHVSSGSQFGRLSITQRLTLALSLSTARCSAGVLAENEPAPRRSPHPSNFSQPFSLAAFQRFSVSAFIF